MATFVILDKHAVPDADYTVEQKVLEDAGVDVVMGECRTAEEIIELAHDADGIGLIYAKLDADVLAQLPQCKVIVRYGVGYDSIDVDAATRQGIAVCNIPDYCLIDVATHTLAMMLDLNRKVTLFDRQVRAGQWNENDGYEVHRLGTQCIGFVGFGAIAQQAARLAGAWGGRLIASDPYASDDVFAAAGVERVSQDELFAQADVISLHVPLNEGTHHLVDAESIARMKEGVMIVNTSRGAVVALDDLIDALRSGRVRAAALDVVEGEPIRDPHHRMWECDTLVVNPHSAYYSAESGHEQHESVGLSAKAVLVDGVIPDNCVNRAALRPSI